MKLHPTRRAALAAGVALLTAVPLAACGADPDPDPAGPDAPAEEGEGAADAFSVLSANEHSSHRELLDALAANQCADANEALPLEHQTVAQSDVVQQVTLLASQGALPVHYIAGTAMSRPEGDLGQADLLLNYEDALTELEAWENVLPAAASTIENVYGHMISLPYQYNIEGIWYNQAILDEHGITEPETWSDLMAAAETLQAAGVVPITQGGADGWPLTRIIGMYIYRNVGPDALEAVAAGEAKLTDPEYVAGAQALADLGAEGYLGEGVVSRGGDISANLFLTGEAAMTYNGSWMLADINNPEVNQIGAENVGLMPFPAVEGGAGSPDQWPANAGTVYATNPELYGPQVGDWLACIAENWGAEALRAGQLSGFRVNEEVADVPEPTQMVKEQIAEIEDTVLWFEALFDSETNSLASTNVSLLVTGQMSAEDYMAALQESIDANAS